MSLLKKLKSLVLATYRAIMLLGVPEAGTTTGTLPTVMGNPVTMLDVVVLAGGRLVLGGV